MCVCVHRSEVTCSSVLLGNGFCHCVHIYVHVCIVILVMVGKNDKSDLSLVRLIDILSCNMFTTKPVPRLQILCHLCASHFYYNINYHTSWLFSIEWFNEPYLLMFNGYSSPLSTHKINCSGYFDNFESRVYFLFAIKWL